MSGFGFGGGFNKYSGPGAPSSSQPRFGDFPHPHSPSPAPHQSPPFPHFGPARSPMNPVPTNSVWSPALTYESFAHAPSAYQSTGTPRKTEAREIVGSAPSSFESMRPVGSPYSSVGAQGPTSSPPQWVNGQRYFSKDDDQITAVTSFTVSRNSGTSIPAKLSTSRFQQLKRTRSPPSDTLDADISKNSTRTLLQSHFNVRTDNSNHLDSAGARPPHLPFGNDNSIEHGHLAFGEGQQPSMSPPRMGARTNTLQSTSYSDVSQRAFSAVSNSAVEDASTRTTNHPVAKRTRSPPLPAADKVIQRNPYISIQDDTEREIQAKAKRYARFKNELTERSESKQDIAEQKASASRREQSMLERQKFAGSYSMESAGGVTNNNIPSDFEGLKTSSIIVGLCPDMCPVPEREERERKGDLDQYERLDGDRNQTNKFIAVKKYTRTAEREANLIRPMPVLQKTIDYLLTLLDHPYDGKFLGIYNFLWDRMRAIRMDLRMQHIFNQEAITMLEQMIRLHIIAMHELCEYTKGEGFSEGFDAHLNIEQMNKTSVELFQMYDDHRKKGIIVPSEKEFRGYYALLKLDKHPGYKVEPAELSLDLAKMTPEIRQTPEVLFARDVARACRTSNFIAFFRLARKASYLQACLMHAHFSKLRTQAFTSLHSGLQNNQGLPIAHVAKWLATEKEDIESLIEYHGFVTKEFEEPYMVKEGPFLNVDQDFPTKRSKLVDQKKSRKIADDVSPALELESLPAQAPQEIQQPKIYKLEKKPVASTSVDRNNSIHEIAVEMPDLQVVSPPKSGPKSQPKVGQQSREDHQMEGAYSSPWGFSMVHNPLVFQPTELKDAEKPNDVLFKMSSEKMTLPVMQFIPVQPQSRTASQERNASAKNGNVVDNTIPYIAVSNDTKEIDRSDINQAKGNDEVMENLQDEVAQANFEDEVAQAKLKLIIRLWKRRSISRRKLREQRLILANAALSCLPLGPPIRKATDQLSFASDLDIEHVIRERGEKHELSWSKLNVSDVIINILSARNPGVGCLCWKVLLFCQINNEGYKLGQRSKVKHVEVSPWLFSKLMPSEKDDDDLLISSSGLSIWKKCATDPSTNYLTRCLSVVRDVKFDSLDQTIDGASAVIFIVSETIPWNVQKAHLQNLLKSIPSGSSLPLLVLCGSYDKEASDPSSTIVGELGLNHIDKSRVSNFLVIFLLGDQAGESLEVFFSDARLREGLQWLASHSPPQPDIQFVKTRELVLTHLNPSLEMLDKLDDHEVGPNHCISVFNEALDWSLREIAAAAKSNPSRWPCPEIALLQDFSEEHKMVSWYLPRIGWSSAARIEALLSAVGDSKLPSFPDAIPWFDGGANSIVQIENRKSQLENSLIRYLTESSEIMTFHLAMKEAHVMLQRSARLELHDFSYYIIPKWTSVFRRIFNWQLTRLSNCDFSSAYVLRNHHVDPNLCALDEFGLKDYVPSAPSLDEMIVGCTPFLPSRGQPESKVVQSLPKTVPNSMDTNELAGDETTEQVDMDTVDHAMNAGGEVMFAVRSIKETDSLSKLLEQCNIVQNSIDEKLYIYF
ncbi:SAC3 family protein B [Euphorbia lathyris]|uniref:SAC3 family protein B n=1 Tax=Euphorbia lathyris TaxID=212925 RepID=UPI00331339D1